MGRDQRKEREFNSRRAAILDIAEGIFAGKGYFGTTMAEIAEASGFAIGSLYQFFESKEDLYKTVITEKVHLMQTKIRQDVSREETSPGKIRSLIHSHFDFVQRNEGFFTILLRWEGISESDGKKALLQTLLANREDYLGFIEEILASGMARGELKEDKPRPMALALLGMMDAFAFDWLIAPGKASLMTSVPYVLALYFNGVKGHEVS